jgi:methylase of polypeptide subunit release factors
MAMGVPPESEGKKVDVAPLMRKAGFSVEELSIVETEGMYPYKKKIEDNWAYYTAVGFERLKELLRQEGKKAETVAIVGIGSGVEGIAAAHVFKDEIKRLIITDVDEGISEGAMHNLRNAVPDKNLEMISLVGSFCEPIEKAGCKVDFVHGNIPNLPATGLEDLSRGAEKGTFLLSATYEGYHPPREFLGWALGAQFAYLKSAKKVLAPGGSVVTELGGRVPLGMFEKLFDSCGLGLQEVIVGFKEQTEALIDFEGYHRLEMEFGTSFEFYLYDESRALLEKNGIENPSFKITASEMKKLLEPYKISAGDAVAMHHKNIPVGHPVLLLRGSR